MQRLFSGRALASLLLSLVLLAAASSAGEIRFLSWDEATQSAQIETAAGIQSVQLGDEVPGFGTVVSLDTAKLLVRRELSAGEQDLLAEQGLTAHRAEQVEVIREDHVFYGFPMPAESEGE